MFKTKMAQIKDPSQLKNFIRQYKLHAKDLPKGCRLYPLLII
jgi:hypothetical protein